MNLYCDYLRADLWIDFQNDGTFYSHDFLIGREVFVDLETR